MQRTLSLAVALMALTSCQRDPVPRPGVLSATEIECGLPIDEPLVANPLDTRPGTYTGSFKYRGPDWCHRALEIFMATRPGYRTAAIIPLEHPVEPVGGVASVPGTQRLIVLDTPGSGPWPHNYEVEVLASACTPTSQGSSCLASVAHASWLPLSSVWVPITVSRFKQPAETSQILMLVRTNEELTRRTYEPGSTE